ncbi:hypothetical protein DSM104443_04288 [Usitatibacter rugosus]|uniref:Uncharacterized protein n=1 Tax=Usitatibacter rugosus TaxID=2732067 RepID=A0A6M4H3B9_9PROT|nr:hypothetical protein [Usitatibacter rugosus]QJR13193.1 hypothetical protein DSM104443_04288 [Usitatibacter rugosus]
MATKKKVTKGKKSTGKVLRKSITVPSGTNEIVLTIHIGKGGTGKSTVMMLASSESPIQPDPPE